MKILDQLSGHDWSSTKKGGPSATLLTSSNDFVYLCKIWKITKINLIFQSFTMNKTIKNQR